MLQASRISRYEGSSLLRWGTPGVLSDVFCRVGGPGTDTGVSVQVMVTIESSRVVLDNMWCWRADHAAGGHIVRGGECRCDTGLRVLGDGVVAYGLAVEHTLSDLVVWRGEGGRVYFYQSEFPYDVREFEGSGYLVEGGVRDHEAHGVGLYSFFRDHEVVVRTAIKTPPGARVVNAFTRFLDGKGEIASVHNGAGEAATTFHRLSYV